VAGPGSTAIETDPQVRVLLRDASGLPKLPALDLSRFDYQFYAAVLGSDPDRRTAFVRRRNPASVVKSGRLLFAYGRRQAATPPPTTQKNLGSEEMALIDVDDPAT